MRYFGLYCFLFVLYCLSSYLSRLKRIYGLPYHGLVTNGTLILANGTTIPYPHIAHGDTQLVKVPDQPAAKRTPQQQANDQANGFEWRNYALVTDNHLGHVNLNDPLYQWSIYIDENKVPWHLRFGMVLTSFQQARMWVEIFRPFGRIAKTHPISRLPTLVTQTATINGFFLHANRFTLERNSCGREVLIHLYASTSGSPNINPVIDFPKEGAFQLPWGLYEVWKLKIQGNGLLTEDENRLGEGITAALERYLSFQEIQQRVINQIPRQEVSKRVNHISFDQQQIGNTPSPPNCGGVTVSMHENWTHGLTSLNTPPAGGHFFNLENVTHQTWDWNGTEITNTNIVRVLFDKDDQEYRIAIRKTTKSLNHKDVYISGEGYQNINDVTYELNGGVCKQRPSPYNRGMHLTTQTVQRSKVVEETAIQINQQVVKTLHLAETRTHQETKVRTVVETGTYQPSLFNPFQSNSYDDNTDSSLSSTIVIQHDDKTVRNFTGLPAQMPSSAFSGVLPSDEPEGVYKTLGLGFVSNNLMGVVTKYHLNKENLNQHLYRTIQGMTTRGVGEPVEWTGQAVFGSYQPMLGSVSINFGQNVGWV